MVIWLLQRVEPPVAIVIIEAITASVVIAIGQINLRLSSSASANDDIKACDWLRVDDSQHAFNPRSCCPCCL